MKLGDCSKELRIKFDKTAEFYIEKWCHIYKRIECEMNKLTISGTKALFYIFWTLLLIGKGLGMTSSNPAMVAITWVATVFAISKLIATKWKKQELVISGILLILGLLVFIKTRDAAVLLTIMSICAAKDIDLRKLFRYSFWLKFGMFFVRTSLALANVIDRQVLVRYDSGNIHTVRYALGYGQPNATHYTLFVIYVLLFLSYKNLKTWMFILLELYNIFIFSYTNSRAGFLMASLLVLCVWAIKSKVIYKIFKSFGKSLCYSYPFLAVLSFATPYFINTLMKYEGLGTFLSRFKTGTAILTTNILTLFGNGNIKTDYGFVFIGFQYGLVVLLVYILANTALMKKFFRQRYYIEFFIVLIYAIYTIVESYSASILMNTSLILLSILLYGWFRSEEHAV